MITLGYNIKIDGNMHHRAKVVARKRELLRHKADQDNSSWFTEESFDKTRYAKGMVRLAKHRTLGSYLLELLP